MPHPIRPRAKTGSSLGLRGVGAVAQNILVHTGITPHHRWRKHLECFIPPHPACDWVIKQRALLSFASARADHLPLHLDPRGSKAYGAVLDQRNFR